MQWFANSNTELDNGSDSTIDFRKGETINALKVETLRVTGNVKGYIPIGRLHPFLLAGAGFMHASGEDRVGLDVTTDGDAFAARFGGGIDVYLNRNFVAVAEAGYVWIPTGKLDHLDHVLWSVGLTYRF